MNESVSIDFPLRQQAAVFVDYENLLDVIRTEHSGDKYPDEYASEILIEAQRYIKNRNNLPISIARAYADFGALDEDAPYIQRGLKRDGFEPRFVPTDLQRNTVELQLALDVVQVTQRYAALNTVVLISGDRPYLPLIRRVVEAGRHVLAIVLFPPQAEDTFFVKDDVFLDARNLLSEASKQAFPAHNRPAYEATAPLEPDEYQPLTDPIVRRTVEVTEEHFGQYDEVYLTPLLRKLSDVLGPEHDPKSLISRLEDAGAVRLEKRNGYPYDYTVLIMHDDHPDVQEIKAELQQRPNYGDGYYEEHYDDYESDNYDEEYADENDADAYDAAAYDETYDTSDAAPADSVEASEAESAPDNGYDEAFDDPDATHDGYDAPTWEQGEKSS